MAAAMGRGAGKTPENVVKKINDEVGLIGQNATARAIGIPLRSVQKYMVGIAEPTKATLERLAAYFGVTVAWLRGEEKTLDDFIDELLQTICEQKGFKSRQEVLDYYEKTKESIPIPLDMLRKISENKTLPATPQNRNNSASNNETEKPDSE